MLYAAGFIVGLILLVWSADRFVHGAAGTARILGVAPLVVGILVVGIGTSAPEMLVSAIAASDGQAGLAVGNALGSNITNIALILGFTALMVPLDVQSRVINREIPLLLLTMLIGLALLWDGELTVVDGSLLLLGFALVIVRQLFEARAGREDILAGEFEESLAEDQLTLRAALLWTAIGLVVLVLSARLMVWAAVAIAQALGVSDLVIGLTVVAVGTSLPELAASLAAARKGEHDIAIGNVIGSNMFNLVGVMALPGVIAPGAIDPGVMARDYPVMIALTVALFLFAWSPTQKKRHINRIEGGALLTAYVSYIGYLLYTTM